ncbi:MAG: hypothetical protein NT040_14940 [Bacteroidetes bacterium]|nr:hypothetical protein [Bacteroidota bacterium]
MEPEKWSDDEARLNYENLKSILETGLANASQAESLHDAKGHLIDVQNHFKGLRLRREDREELYGRLQEAFANINRKIEEDRLNFENEAFANYADLKPVVADAAGRAVDSEDMKATWDLLLDLQGRIRSSKLLREHRDELYASLQDAFGMIKLRRDEERKVFDQEAQHNYTRLKSLVEKGLKQAEETHEYKETREFLKKIQSEFRGIKMVHDQREELYSRLQTAFDILGKRLDDFFRHKKKNWEVKMQFTLSRISVDIFELQTALEKEESYLKELEDQLEITASAGKEREVITGLQARINSTRRGIEQKRRQIDTLEVGKNELQNRLEDPDL